MNLGAMSLTKADSSCASVLATAPNVGVVAADVFAEDALVSADVADAVEVAAVEVALDVSDAAAEVLLACAPHAVSASTVAAAQATSANFFPTLDVMRSSLSVGYFVSRTSIRTSCSLCMQHTFQFLKTSERSCHGLLGTGKHCEASPSLWRVPSIVFSRV